VTVSGEAVLSDGPGGPPAGPARVQLQ